MSKKRTKKEKSFEKLEYEKENYLTKVSGGVKSDKSGEEDILEEMGLEGEENEEMASEVARAFTKKNRRHHFGGRFAGKNGSKFKIKRDLEEE